MSSYFLTAMFVVTEYYPEFDIELELGGGGQYTVEPGVEYRVYGWAFGPEETGCTYANDGICGMYRYHVTMTTDAVVELQEDPPMVPALGWALRSLLAIGIGVLGCWSAGGAARAG